MSIHRSFAASVFVAFCLSATVTLADPPRVTQLTAELEMKDFHDTAAVSGPLEPGQPVVLTFKNKTMVKILPLAVDEKLIRLKTLLLGSSGGTLYNATFATKYNAEAELYEKRPDGDLIYRLKLNPQIQEQK